MCLIARGATTPVTFRRPAEDFGLRSMRRLLNALEQGQEARELCDRSIIIIGTMRLQVTFFKASRCLFKIMGIDLSRLPKRSMLRMWSAEERLG